MNENKSDSSGGTRASEALTKLGSLVESAEDGIGVFQNLADELDEAVFMVDRDQTILLFNRRAEELTGFSRDQVLGRHCLRGIRCSRCLESCGVFEKERIRDVPLEIFRSDGSVLEVLKSGAVVRDREGREVGAVEVMHPVVADDADDGEEKGPATASAAWMGLEMAMESLGRGFVLLDESFAVTEASSSIEELFAAAPGALRGRPAAEFLGDNLFAEGSGFRDAMAAGERVEGWRAHARTKDGHVRTLSVSGAPMTTRNEASGQGSCARASYLVVVRPEPESNELVADHGGKGVFEGMVARSPAMRRIFHLIEQLRDNDASVLITGESGTGKELIARAVHARSTRANEPFMAVNCAALPADLLESELFGHARGSFTGAVQDKAGRFEVVEGGTIFLDEIGDMPLPLQVKLLRVLQERSFERVGETRVRRFRARVIAATHQDLVRLVLEKRFRQDLFYRLNVVPIAVPPLRERREDLDLLIHHLLERIGKRRLRARRLSPTAARTLLSYDWPGNVRQIENALEYATAVCEGQTIHREDLPPEIASPEAVVAPSADGRVSATRAADGARSAAGPPPTTPEDLDRYPSARDILDALQKCRYRRGKAAKMLGVSRTTLWRRMREEGLSTPRAHSSVH